MAFLRPLMACLLALAASVTLAHSTLSDITEGDEERVTLPVIPESKLLIHATEGIDVSSASGPVQSLPLAIFLTRKSPEEVTAWYQKALPDFITITDTTGEQIQILQHVEPDTTVDDPGTYLTPNIRIRPTDARMSTHMKGAETVVQIFYPPEGDTNSDGGS